MKFDQAIPILALQLAALFAWRDVSWPGVMALTAGFALYGAMRFLERDRSNEIEEFKSDLATLKSRVSDLAMRSGANGL